MTLHLVLKSCWYDKIASGEKTSEYREIKPYWNKRIGSMFRHETVVFHRGYTHETMEFKIKNILKTTAKNDLGLPKVWEIELGERIPHPQHKENDE